MSEKIKIHNIAHKLKKNICFYSKIQMKISVMTSIVSKIYIKLGATMLEKRIDYTGIQRIFFYKRFWCIFSLGALLILFECVSLRLCSKYYAHLNQPCTESKAWTRFSKIKRKSMSPNAHLPSFSRSVFSAIKSMM